MTTLTNVCMRCHAHSLSSAHTKTHTHAHTQEGLESLERLFCQIGAASRLLAQAQKPDGTKSV